VKVLSKQSDHGYGSCKEVHPRMNHYRFLTDEHDGVITDCAIFHEGLDHSTYKKTSQDSFQLPHPDTWGPGVTELETVYIDHMHQLGVLAHLAAQSLFGWGWGSEGDLGDIKSPFAEEWEPRVTEYRDWQWPLQELAYSERLPGGWQHYSASEQDEDDYDIPYELIYPKLKSEHYLRARQLPLEMPRNVDPYVESLRRFHDDTPIWYEEEVYVEGRPIPVYVRDNDKSREIFAERLRKQASESMRAALQDSLISQFTAIRSSFISNLATSIMRKDPRKIPSDISFDWGELRDVPDHEELIGIAIRKYMDQKFWRNGLKGELKWLNGICNNELEIDDHTIQRVRENDALRNAIAHSSSKATSGTLIRVPWLDMEEGERILVSSELMRCLIRSHANFFSRIAMKISEELQERFVYDFSTYSCYCDDSYKPDSAPDPRRNAMRHRYIMSTDWPLDGREFRGGR
jgi:hypothetical protein